MWEKWMRWTTVEGDTRRSVPNQPRILDGRTGGGCRAQILMIMNLPTHSVEIWTGRSTHRDTVWGLGIA